jgi:hypothetical protein
VDTTCDASAPSAKMHYVCLGVGGGGRGVVFTSDCCHRWVVSQGKLNPLTHNFLGDGVEFALFTSLRQLHVLHTSCHRCGAVLGPVCHKVPTPAAGALEVVATPLCRAQRAGDTFCSPTATEPVWCAYRLVCVRRGGGCLHCLCFHGCMCGMPVSECGCDSVTRTKCRLVQQ